MIITLSTLAWFTSYMMCIKEVIMMTKVRTNRIISEMGIIVLLTASSSTRLKIVLPCVDWAA